MWAVCVAVCINVSVRMCVLSEDAVQVKEIVQEVRRQRPGMVQTEAQYKFLYDIIPHIVDAQKTVHSSVYLKRTVALVFVLVI